MPLTVSANITSVQTFHLIKLIIAYRKYNRATPSALHTAHDI